RSWIAGVWFGSQTPEDDRKSDWAILLLQDPIGDTTGWFGVDSINLEHDFPVPVSLAAYASDKSNGEIPQYTKECYLHKLDDRGRVLHDCDAVSGSSGGVLFTRQSPQKVVALAA